MASPSSRATTVASPEHHRHTTGTVIFSFICLGLTAFAVLSVVVLFCQYRVRSRAPVTAAVAEEGGTEGRRRGAGANISKLPEFAYTQSARRDGGSDGAQCSVCLGTVQAGEMVRRLPLCKHLYHVECIDMWLASHTTCPLCRADVEPPVEGVQAMQTEPPELTVVV
ncbi:hypothetical protein BS78_10G156000 [Paspalum vaginatum]|nr:hypothetical protein BS78_10G156000 [Paspalum vaginatum]